MNEAMRIGLALAATLGWSGLVAASVVRHRRTRVAVAPATILVVDASQTGNAVALADATAAALTASGCTVTRIGIAALRPDHLRATDAALFVAATTGEGDPPDDAAPFLHAWHAAPPALGHLHYAVLALGDRHYRHFCAFGNQLDALLRRAGAQPRFDRVEVDAGDPGAIRHWQQSLRLFGAATDLPDWQPPAYRRWRLAERTHLNPGSPGAPLYRIRLTPDEDGIVWRAGDVAELYPGPADAAFAPHPPLPHREYSPASLPHEGGLDLLVRLFHAPDGTPGLGSGWLCTRAAIGARVALRLRANPGFHAPDPAVPMLLVGNGTGLAALRAHLVARAPGTRNWLVYGERDPAHDRPLADTLEQWRRDGLLERLDLVFSRGADADARYVQHRLAAEAPRVRDWVAAGGAVYLCGSIAMAEGVDAALADILGADGLRALAAAGRYRRDAY